MTTLAALALGLAFSIAPPAGVVGSGDGYHVSRHAGLALWSRRTDAGFRLVVRRDGGPARLAPVAPAPFWFDVDAGTDARGRTVAVYSRCRADLRAGSDLPARAGCDLYRFDPATGEEERIDALSTAAEEVRPAIHRGEVAFARLDGAAIDVLVERRRFGRHVLGGGGARPEDVLGLAHGAPGVAFAVHDHEARANVMYLSRRDAPGVEAVGGGGIGEENDRLVRDPGFAGRSLYWAYANQHPSSAPELRGWIVRFDLRTGDVVGAPAPGYLTSVAPAPGGRFLAVSDTSDELPRYVFGRQRLHVLRPLFGRVPAEVG